MTKVDRSQLSVIGIIIVILIAGNLRSPITSLSPVLSEIMTKLGLSNFQGSLLTSIPLLVFAGGSVLVSRIGAKIRIQYTLGLSLILLILGLYLRVYGSVSMLYIGSFLIGIGICIGNVMTPAYIKQVFPDKIGLMTGVFSVTMNLFAALAAGYSIAIGEWTQLGWRGSLGIWIIWSIPALLVLSIELFLSKKRSDESKSNKILEGKFNAFRSKQAWYISIFMGIQSLVYFCVIAMLPTVLIDYGMDKGETGFVLLAFQLVMAPVMFICPVIASKMKEQQSLIYLAGALMVGGIGLLTIFKTQYIYFTAVMIGTSTGLAFSLSILFFSLKSRTTDGTIKVSGQAQSIGYLIAALGPPVFGVLHDWDSSWNMSFYFLIVMAVILTFSGIGAAKARFVEDY